MYNKLIFNYLEKLIEFNLLNNKYDVYNNELAKANHCLWLVEKRICNYLADYDIIIADNEDMPPIAELLSYDLEVKI